MVKRFSEYMKLTELCSEHSVYIPENFDWAKSYASMMPRLDLGLPTITKRSKIYILQANRNPISIHFEDGSKIFCSYDQFRRMPNGLAVGKMAEFTLLDNGGGSPMVIKSLKIIS